MSEKKNEVEKTESQTEMEKKLNDYRMKCMALGEQLYKKSIAEDEVDAILKDLKSLDREYTALLKIEQDKMLKENDAKKTA